MSDTPVYTVRQFCAVEGISPAHLYSLWQRGEGPAYYTIGRHRRGHHRRITEQARQDWHSRREAETNGGRP
jgi:hypothetical protein